MSAALVLCGVAVGGLIAQRYISVSEPLYFYDRMNLFAGWGLVVGAPIVGLFAGSRVRALSRDENFTYDELLKPTMFVATVVLIVVLIGAIIASVELDRRAGVYDPIGGIPIYLMGLLFVGPMLFCLVIGAVQILMSIALSILAVSEQLGKRDEMHVQPAD